MAIASRKGIHKMHLKQLTKISQVLILLTMIVKEFQAEAMNEEDGAEISISGERAKRGANAVAPNDYGPAIKITSGILQLTKSAEGSTTAGDVDFERHETALEHPWPAVTGYQLPAAHTVWLEIPANTQDFHLLAMPNSDNNRHQPSAGAGHAAEASGSMPEGTSQFSKGLHTQIISSSSKDVTHVSDNLDFSEVNENKAKRNHRTSYGR